MWDETWWPRGTNARYWTWSCSASSLKQCVHPSSAYMGHISFTYPTPANHAVSSHLGLLLLGINTRYLLNIFKEGQWSTLCFYFCGTTNSFELPLYFWMFVVPVSPCLLISLQGRDWDFQMLIFIELFLRWSSLYSMLQDVWRTAIVFYDVF